jgi:predicted nucleic acid-binding protein
LKRLFLDANVLFTAAHKTNGKAALLISLGEQGIFELYSSTYAKDEASRNLARKCPSCLTRFERIMAAITLITGHSLQTCPAGLPEKDWPIYRAAHACQADVLVTGDLRNFGALMNQPERADGLLIQTTADVLNTLSF